MYFKKTLKTCLVLFLLAAVTCSASETTSLENTTKMDKTSFVGGLGREFKGNPSDVLVSLGDKKLTLEQIKWMEPDADEQKVIYLANWWLEDELLLAEAEKRGITEEPKMKFLAELIKKKEISKELVLRVRNSISMVSDKEVLDYYEKNKNDNTELMQPGYLSFSHIRTETLEQAQAVAEKIKAGEDIGELAKKLSIYGDAKNGGQARKYLYNTVKERFGDEFFEAIMAVEKDRLIGPVKVKKDAYEVARLENKTEPKPLPFEKVKDQIRLKLQREASDNAFDSLLNSLKKQAADKIVMSPLITQTGKSEAQKDQKDKESAESKQK